MPAFELKGEVIIINRELTELDLFVRDFLDILKKYSGYLIVSGFVSISAGRVRATEDVDLLLPKMSRDMFAKLFNDLTANGFWCYQSDSPESAFEYFNNSERIRLARVNQLFPNIEVIPIDESKKLQYFEYKNPKKMRIGDFEFLIPPLEFEVLYKELVLGSEKDLSDARHLRTIFSSLLNEENFLKFRRMIEDYASEKRD